MRFLIFGATMLIFILHHQLVCWVIRNQVLRHKYFLRSISWHCRFLLWLLGVKRDFQSLKAHEGSVLYVANHLSYIDMLVLFEKYPSLFITSREVEETPILGHICKLAGCFFVERRKDRIRSVSTQLEMSRIKQELTRGFDVFLFPEGTSSDGSKVLPFKSTFFQVPVDLKLPIVPLVIQYDSPLVCWYGDAGFVSHLWQLCRGKRFNSRITELPAFCPLSERQHLASLSFELISGEYAQA